MKGAIHDIATDNEISVAAASVLDKCVFRYGARHEHNVPIGGYRGYIGSYYTFLAPGNRQVLFRLTRLLLLGRKAGLAIKISSYKPNVHCAFYSDYNREGTGCSKLLGVLSVGGGPYVFARQKITGERNVIIPPGGKKIESGEHCILFCPLLHTRTCALSLFLSSIMIICSFQIRALRPSISSKGIPTKALGLRCGLRLWLSMSFAS